MHPTLPLPAHQTRSLQGLLHPAIAQLNLVLRSQLLVEMAYVQIEILLPIQAEQLLDHNQQHPLGTRLSQSAIEQAVISNLLVAPVPSPHLSIGYPDDLGGLPPANLLRQSS